jgi:membrane protein DedA with SNARE-associated domain
MIVTIFDILTSLITQLISFMGYGGIFFLMLVESCGIPMPSEIIMPFAGYLVSNATLMFWPVVLMGTLGNLTGSLIAYWIGIKGGRPFIERYGKYVLISKHDLDLADRWYMKRGSATTFVGRLLPVVRTYISFSAGIARMDLRKFSLYTFLGALPWCILFTWLGVQMGANWGLVREKLHEFDLVIIALIILAVGYYVWRHVALEKKTQHDHI